MYSRIIALSAIIAVSVQLASCAKRPGESSADTDTSAATTSIVSVATVTTETSKGPDTSVIVPLTSSSPIDDTSTTTSTSRGISSTIPSKPDSLITVHDVSEIERSIMKGTLPDYYESLARRVRDVGFIPVPLYKNKRVYEYSDEYGSGDIRLIYSTSGFHYSHIVENGIILIRTHYINSADIPDAKANLLQYRLGEKRVQEPYVNGSLKTGVALIGEKQVPYRSYTVDSMGIRQKAVFMFDDSYIVTVEICEDIQIAVEEYLKGLTFEHYPVK